MLRIMLRTVAFALVLRGCSKAAIAQVAIPSGNTRALERTREIGKSALQHLRNSDFDQALDALGEVADLDLPLPVNDDNGLSAAAAGLHRALTQLSPEEQFDVLYKWTIPGGSRSTLRMLTATVPTESPPAEFARALGERPRPTSFPTAAIGEIRGVFSTAWSLVSAAKEAGKLRRLMTELELLAAKKVPRADLLLSLAQLADSRGDASKLIELLEQRTAQITAAVPKNGAGPNAIDPGDLVLGLAVLSHPALRSPSEDLFAALVNSTCAQPAARLRPLLRQAHATAALLVGGATDATALTSTQPKYWIPVTGSGLSSVEATWLVHEDHILHFAGSDNDLLLLQYPLTGDFEFRCETQDGGRMETAGGLIYGGRSFQVVGSPSQFSSWDVNGVSIVKRPCPFVRYGSRATFNRMAITSTGDSAVFSVNLHPMSNDNVGGGSPWLGLRSFGEKRPLFRNLKILGNPVIPREVRLADGDALRGWQSRFWSERPNYPPPASDPDWQLAGGIIKADRTAERQSRLRYQRPLLAGESVSYEFLYEPGAWEVHPALGRVAFLLQPDGVRIHWITDNDADWTGLSVDNAVVEPLSRRGPRQLPLKEREWNHATLARGEKSVTVSLNGTVIYQRPVDWRDDGKFGLFCDRTKSGVQVRNVVMTGDWPESLPPELIANPAVAAGEPLPIAARHALNELFQDEFLAENARAVRHHAAGLPPAERLQYLSNSLLPGPDHAGFRLSGEFTQTHPSPLAESGSTLGGEMVSPVFDWLDVAKELKQLDALRQRIVSVPDSSSPDQQRARAALLTLVNLELGDEAAATSECAKLFALVKATTATGIEDQWPEAIVMWRGVRRFPDQGGVSDLLTLVFTQRTLQWKPEGIYGWHNQIASLTALLQERDPPGDTTAESPQFVAGSWIPASTHRALTRGAGHPPAQWRWSGNRIDKVSGHESDFLFYRLPLRGNYEVECELTNPNSLPCQIMLAGAYVGARWNHKEIETGAFRGSSVMVPVDPPFTTFGPRVRYRGVVRDGVCTVSLNGRQVQATTVADDSDPWVAIRTWGRFHGGVQNLRIFGNPTVLDAVPLSASRDLTGWNPYFLQDTIATTNARWQHVEDPESTGWIVGKSDAGLKGTYSESLLCYQRPLVDDESINYEFFYAPGRQETHPALDRLAFVLDPHGVREHWITDDRFDSSDVTPDNIADAAQHRRGSAELQLHPLAWNRVKLALRGNTVSIELNGKLVYERALEPNNQRTFGLFHYVDRSEVRVRNVMLRGDWPRSLPQVAEQELAGSPGDALDADLPRLKAVFAHDFRRGLPDNYFKPRNVTNGAQLSLTQAGLHVTRPATGTWVSTDILAKFSVHGDFDIEAAYEQLDIETEMFADVRLVVTLNDERKHHLRVIRQGKGKTNKQEMISSLAILQPDGSRSYTSQITPSEATSGRLRMARRGDKIYFLHAEGDSPTFHRFATETLSGVETELEGVHLWTTCNGNGVTNAIWKNLIIRAERLMIAPDANDPALRQLHVMRPDGSERRVVTTPRAAGFLHIGSPEWSADGRKIAMDMSNGSTANSHVIVVDADGTNLVDLGPGCMPSFSPNGKKIVLSQSGAGIVMMNADGSGREVIDPAGWATQWSPNGKLIACGKGGNIAIIDADTRKERLLLIGDAAARYNYTYWNLGWSHDSRSIGFKGRRSDDNTDEFAVADVDAPQKFHVLLANAKQANPKITWSPDNTAVVFSMNGQLYSVNRRQPGLPQLLPGQPTDCKILDADWSANGKWIASTTQQVPQPVEWVATAADQTLDEVRPVIRP